MVFQRMPREEKEENERIIRISSTRWTCNPSDLPTHYGGWDLDRDTRTTSKGNHVRHVGNDQEYPKPTQGYVCTLLTQPSDQRLLASARQFLQHEVFRREEH